jgi:hypothetical protein
VNVLLALGSSERNCAPKWQEKFGYALETSNNKHQMTNKFQWSKFQAEGECFDPLKLRFGIYLGFAIWDLDFQPC